MLNNHIKWHKDYFESIINSRAEYLESLLKMGISKTKKRKFRNALDIGCGTGEFTNSLKKYSDKVLGIDLMEKNISAAKLKFQDSDFLVKNVYDIDIKEKFDIVTAFSFFEHVENLNMALSSVHNSQVKNGFIIIQVPNPYFFVELHTYIPFNFLIPSFIRWNLFPKLGYSKDPVLKSNLSIGKLKKALLGYYEILYVENLIYPIELIPKKYSLIYKFLKRIGAFKLVPFGYLLVCRKK